MTNAVLEEDDSLEAEDGSDLGDRIFPEADLAAYLAGPDEPREDPARESTYPEPAAPAETLHDHLLLQLHLASLPKRIERAGEFLLGQLDDDGYLTSPPGRLRTLWRDRR